MAKSSSVKKKPAPRKPSAPPQAAAAFDKVLAEIEALSPDRLIPVNLDVPRVVSQVLGVSPGLVALRPAIAEHLPTFDVARLDRLDTYALAAWYAHLLSLSSGDVESALKPLLAEAAPLRENLLGDAEALARRGLLDAETVADIRAGQGYIDTANDLVALSALFSASWSEIAGRTVATEEEVKRAGEIGPQLLAALGPRRRAVRHGGPAGPRRCAQRRARRRLAPPRPVPAAVHQDHSNRLFLDVRQISALSCPRDSAGVIDYQYPWQADDSTNLPEQRFSLRGELTLRELSRMVLEQPARLEVGDGRMRLDGRPGLVDQAPLTLVDGWSSGAPRRRGPRSRGHRGGGRAAHGRPGARAALRHGQRARLRCRRGRCRSAVRAVLRGDQCGVLRCGRGRGDGDRRRLHPRFRAGQGRHRGDQRAGHRDEHPLREDPHVQAAQPGCP
ncbi:hypothetical protein ACMHYB_00915 [Sorangium sp. So ce1128]